ncbi:hypothetical protein AAY473_035224 [Plecturocebus cupreus]
MGWRCLTTHNQMSGPGWSWVSPRLECSNMISAHCNLCLPEVGFCCVGQADLELLSSSDPLASAFQSAGITGVSYRARSSFSLFSSPALSPRLECSSAVWAHSRLGLLGSSDPPTLASLVAGTTGVHHHTQLIFTEFLDVAQSGLKLLSSSDLSTVTSQSVGITVAQKATTLPKTDAAGAGGVHTPKLADTLGGGWSCRASPAPSKAQTPPGFPEPGVPRVPSAGRYESSVSALSTVAGRGR